MPTADVEEKLRKLTAVDFNYRNWSLLLNSNRPPVPPVILKVPASGKHQLALEHEESIEEKSNPDFETESARRVSQPVISPRKLKFRREKALDKKKRALALSSRLSRRGYVIDFLLFFWKLFPDVLFSFPRGGIGSGSMNPMMR